MPQPMIEFTPADQLGQRVLLTPGPLTTTRTVREAMTLDIGSWDTDCIQLVKEIREGLLKLAGNRTDLTCTLLQGSGSFGVEAMIGSAVPRDGKLLVINNGAYGRRMVNVAQVLQISHAELVFPEDAVPIPAEIDAALAKDTAITHVACVHCETTTGVLNPIREIGLIVAKHKRRYLVDAISSFAAYPVGANCEIDFDAGPIDHLAGSANKCVEGVPGFAFVISRRDAMEATKGCARSVCLDLHAQWTGLEQSGKFRFTPPTHVMLAFRQALRELEIEGGWAGREKRYRNNHAALMAGMTAMGFKGLVPANIQSHIITSFLYPCPDFNFASFYDGLRKRGYIIYPGKLTNVDTFRIGNIGSIGTEEIAGLLDAIKKTMAEL